MLPRIGQTLRLNVHSSSEEMAAHSFKSRVTDIQDGIAAIELPTSEKTGRTGLLEVGTACTVWYIGEDGSRYEFQSSIEGRQSVPLPVLFLKLPEKEDIVRTQRRNYLRIDASLDMAVKLIDPIRNYHFITRTVDLSGGGLSFTCKDTFHLQENDTVKVWLAFPSKTGQIQHASAELEIVRIQPPEEKGLNQWVSGKFKQISEADRVKLVRACYERQLELRRKGVVE